VSTLVPQRTSNPKSVREALDRLRQARTDRDQAGLAEARVSDLGKRVDEKAAAVRAEFKGRLGPKELYQKINRFPEQQEIEEIHGRRREAQARVEDELRGVRGLLSRLAIREPGARIALEAFAGLSPHAATADVDAVIELLEELAGPASAGSRGEPEPAGTPGEPDHQQASGAAGGAGRRDRGPDLETSRTRVDLEDQLQRELATVFQRAERYTTVEKLKQKYPAFKLWTILSGPEQEELLTEPLRPRAYARSLVMRQYGLSSRETLKRDRQKLRHAQK